MALAKIGFSSTQNDNFLNKTPLKIDVIGTDDCDINDATFSYIALSVENSGFERKEVDEFKSWITPEENRRLHFCWGLRVNSTYRSDRSGTALHNLLMWEAWCFRKDGDKEGRKGGRKDEGNDAREEQEEGKGVEKEDGAEGEVDEHSQTQPQYEPNIVADVVGGAANVAGGIAGGVANVLGFFGRR